MDMCEIEWKLTKKELMLSPELVPNENEEGIYLHGTSGSDNQLY